MQNWLSLFFYCTKKSGSTYSAYFAPGPPDKSWTLYESGEASLYYTGSGSAKYSYWAASFARPTGVGQWCAQYFLPYASDERRIPDLGNISSTDNGRSTYWGLGSEIAPGVDKPWGSEAQYLPGGGVYLNHILYRVAAIAGNENGVASWALREYGPNHQF